MNDIFQVDYLPNEKKIKINLPEEVWKNIDTIIMTRLFHEELVVDWHEGFCLECPYPVNPEWCINNGESEDVI